MKHAIAISLLLCSMTNQGMQHSNEVDQFFACVLGAVGMIGTGGIILYANHLANKNAQQQAMLKDQDPRIELMNRYQSEYEKEKVEQEKLLSHRKKTQEELATLKDYLESLSNKPNDIISFEQWISSRLDS